MTTRRPGSANGGIEGRTVRGRGKRGARSGARRGGVRVLRVSGSAVMLFGSRLARFHGMKRALGELGSSQGPRRPTHRTVSVLQIELKSNSALNLSVCSPGLPRGRMPCAPAVREARTAVPKPPRQWLVAKRSLEVTAASILW